MANLTVDNVSLVEYQSMYLIGDQSLCLSFPATAPSGHWKVERDSIRVLKFSLSQHEIIRQIVGQGRLYLDLLAIPGETHLYLRYFHLSHIFKYLTSNSLLSDPDNWKCLNC